MNDACLVCGGRLKWFPEVHAWRHIWVPEGTTPHLAVRQERRAEEPEHDVVPPATLGAAGYIADIVESDHDTGQRVVESREEIEARGQAMREAMGDTWRGYVRPVVDITPPSAIVDPDKLVEHPKPEVPARLLQSGDPWPAPAETTRNLLLAHGWDVELVYARGWRPDAHQRRSWTKLIHLAVVRGRRPAMSEMVVATWRSEVDGDGSWKYDGGYWRVPGDTEKLGAVELKAKIKMPVMRCADCGAGPYTHRECS